MYSRSFRHQLTKNLHLTVWGQSNPVILPRDLKKYPQFAQQWEDWKAHLSEITIGGADW